MKNTLNNDGFSLVEIVTVVVIIGFMAAIALPAYFSWVPNMRLKADTRELHTAFMKAKAEAAKRNRMVAVTFDQPVGGTPSAYVVYEDLNGDFQLNAGETVITNVQQWSDHVSLSAETFTNNGAGDPSMAFRPNTIPEDTAGSPPGCSTPAPGCTVSLTSSKGRTLSIAVSPAGSVTIN